MRIKSRLIEFASIGLLVAFAAPDSFAQGAQPGAKGSQPQHVGSERRSWLGPSGQGHGAQHEPNRQSRRARGVPGTLDGRQRHRRAALWRHQHSGCRQYQ